MGESRIWLCVFLCTVIHMPQALLPERHLWTVAEVAVLLREHPETIRARILRGEIRASQAKSRGPYRVASSDLTEYLAGLPEAAPELNR